MSHQTELIKKLQEIFQIDRTDLDFGIYRILNSRSQEIGDYLQNKLPAKIQAAFSASGQTQIDGWKRELAEAEKAASFLKGGFFSFFTPITKSMPPSERL